MVIECNMGKRWVVVMECDNDDENRIVDGNHLAHSIDSRLLAVKETFVRIDRESLLAVDHTNHGVVEVKLLLHRIWFAEDRVVRDT